MPKPRNGSLGRKVKMSQPIAIPWDLAIALVSAKVVKGPAVPKMEVMEKWIVGGGRDLEITHDREAGLTIATLVCPGPDGSIEYQGTDVTMALATANAIHEYCKAQPLPDPSGADLPLFKGNGGVASVAEMELQRVSVDEIARDLDAEIRAGAIPGVSITGDGLVTDAESTDEPLPPVRDWRFLFVVDPQDRALWETSVPTHDGSPLVDWEDGDDSNDRGWYLDPGYVYDHAVGWITMLNPEPGEKAVVWSRDPDPKPAKKKGAVEATRVNLVTATADA